MTVDSPCVPGSAAPPGVPGRAERGSPGATPRDGRTRGRPSARCSPLAPWEVLGPWRRHSSMDLSTLGKRKNPWVVSPWAQFYPLGLLLLLFALSLLFAGQLALLSLLSFSSFVSLSSPVLLCGPTDQLSAGPRPGKKRDQEQHTEQYKGSHNHGCQPGIFSAKKRKFGIF